MLEVHATGDSEIDATEPTRDGDDRARVDVGGRRGGEQLLRPNTSWASETRRPGGNAMPDDRATGDDQPWRPRTTRRLSDRLESRIWAFGLRPAKRIVDHRPRWTTPEQWRDDGPQRQRRRDDGPRVDADY